MTNTLRFGEVSFDEAIDLVTNVLANEKQVNYRDRAFLTGIEGLSSTGKSTMAGKLERALQSRALNALAIEGDLFQRSREESMKKYVQLLSAVENGEQVPNNFPEGIWDYGKMNRELIHSLEEFNRSGRESENITLKNVLTAKKPGTEHDEVYTIDKRTIVLATGMYLRQVPGFEYIVFLDVSPETSVKRKLERDAKNGVVRDPVVTEKMVRLIEAPIMLRNIQNNPRKKGIVLDVSDFNNITGFDIEGYESPYYKISS